MQRTVLGTLILTLVVVPLAVSYPILQSNLSSTTEIERVPNFEALTKTFGETIPVVVRLSKPLEVVLDDLRYNGLTFSLGCPATSKVGDYYLLRGTPNSLSSAYEDGLFEEISPQTPARHLQSPRDVSIPEINADDVWRVLDTLGNNVTGKGLLIADLDSGIDWKHPDFWYADGGSYEWLDVLSDNVFSNGTDGVDLNDDGAIDTDEVLYSIDIDRDGTHNTTTDWLWADNVTQDAAWQLGEPFFVVNDTNSNDSLDLGEPLVMLKTPKTQYIVEADGTPSRNTQVWERGVNLTVSTHEDTSGHGTAVSGILLGGQLGYRKYVGVAPDADLMMIRVLGQSNDWLTVEDALAWAYNHGADVILTEIGSWTYEYLDGSSTAETLIDTIVADGIPVISPSGNLGGKDKHALSKTTSDVPYQADFHVPNIDPHIQDVYITVLSVNNTDFSTCNFSIIINFLAWGGPIGYTIYLNPGSGYLNFNAEPAVNFGGNLLQVESFISTSSRSTEMLGLHIFCQTAPIPHTSPPNGPPYHQLNVTTPSNTTLHSYISDDKTSWTGGAVWMTDISNGYHITWPSTADSALSVASYRTRDLVSASTIGDIASFSSRGPRIDEVQKQGVAAPGGYDIITDYSNASTWASWYNAYGSLPFDDRFASYQLFSGTSASGPHVAGCAALMLQMNSSIGTQVSSIIKDTAHQDGFTGLTPNTIWGSGKLDALAAVSFVADTPPLIGTPDWTPETPTSSDDVTLVVNVEDADGVDTVILSYNNGTAWYNLTMNWNGTYFVGVIPAQSNGTTVTIQIFANDTMDKWSIRSGFQYTVFDPTTTTTTTSTTTTTTTITTTTNTTTTTDTTTDQTSTTSEDVPQADTMRLAILLSAIIALVVIACLLSRRSSQR